MHYCTDGTCVHETRRTGHESITPRPMLIALQRITPHIYRLMGFLFKRVVPYHESRHPRSRAGIISNGIREMQSLERFNVSEYHSAYHPFLSATGGSGYGLAFCTSAWMHKAGHQLQKHGHGSVSQPSLLTNRIFIRSVGGREQRAEVDMPTRIVISLHNYLNNSIHNHKTLDERHVEPYR